MIINKKFGSVLLANFEKDQADGEAVYHMPGEPVMKQVWENGTLKLEQECKDETIFFKTNNHIVLTDLTQRVI